MQPTDLPTSLLISAAELAECYQQPAMRLLDIGKASIYEQVHIPGALAVRPADLVRASDSGATGLLPAVDQLQALLTQWGITPQHQVIVYDDEGGGWAGRLMWTLHCCGITQVRMLDGGIHAWLAAGLPVESEASTMTVPADQVVTVQAAAARDWQIDIGELMQQVADQEVQLWDCRSLDEYRGIRLAARRGGHIAGARWLEWTDLIDREAHLTLRPLPQVRELLLAAGITGEQPLVVYCQSHHRSGLAYVVARLLGWPVQAYAGGWSEWGNRPDTAVLSAQGLPQPSHAG